VFLHVTLFPCRTYPDWIPNGNTSFIFACKVEYLVFEVLRYLLYLISRTVIFTTRAHYFSSTNPWDWTPLL